MIFLMALPYPIPRMSKYFARHFVFKHLYLVFSVEARAWQPVAPVICLHLPVVGRLSTTEKYCDFAQWYGAS